MEVHDDSLLASSPTPPVHRSLLTKSQRQQAFARSWAADPEASCSQAVEARLYGRPPTEQQIARGVRVFAGVGIIICIVLLIFLITFKGLY